MQHEGETSLAMSTPTSTRLTHEDVIIRQAIEADRPTIEYIASKTWDGDDYLADIFDKWMNEAEGAFNVMTYQDAVVSTSKLTKMGEGEWWMEGLRVNPDYQGRGLARIMHHYIVNQARQQGEGIVRFATSSENPIVHKLAGETGFKLMGDFARLNTTVEETSVTWRQLTIDDVDTYRAWLDTSPYYNRVERSFEHRWRLQLGTDDILRQQLSNGYVYAWNPDGGDRIIGLFVINEVHPKRPEFLTFGFHDTQEQPTPFWQAAKGLGYTLGMTELRVKIINEAQYTQPMMDAGWELQGDERMFVFSRPLSLVGEADVRFEDTPSIDQ